MLVYTPATYSINVCKFNQAEPLIEPCFEGRLLASISSTFLCGFFQSFFCATLIATCEWQPAQLAQLSVTCEWHSQDNFHMKKHGEICFQNKQLYFAFVGKSRM